MDIPRGITPVLGLLVWLVGIPLAHGVVPWAVSLLTLRHGWMQGHPGIWNRLGLIPIVAGSAGLGWVMILGLAHTHELPPRVRLDWTPKLLLRRGPYAFTRNPMYVGELALWAGWAILFGSSAVSIGFIVLCVLVSLLVRREERDLEAQFGEAYREYKKMVPRWLGRT